MRRVAGNLLPGHIDENDGFGQILKSYSPLKGGSHALNNPLQTLNETAMSWVNITQEHVQNVTHQNGKNDAVKAMRIRLNGKGDTRALAVSVLFSASASMASFGLFYLLRDKYPMLYADNGPEDCTVGTITQEMIIKDVGLDAWMLLSFQEMALRIIVGLSVLAVVLCPYHFWVSNPDQDLLTRLSFSGVTSNANILWLHVGAMYLVVLCSTIMMMNAKKAFTKLRYDWLQRMPAPRSTTLLIEGIPEQVCNDAGLAEYFKNTFSAQAIVRAYVVRKTSLLERRLHRLEMAKAWEARQEAEHKRRLEQQREESSSGRLPLHPETSRVSVPFRSVEIEELEVSAERARLMVAGHSFDPEVCSDCGFVTFATRMDARRALHEQFGEDNEEFRLREAPDPSDVVFQNLQVGRSFLTELVGWAAIAGLFAAWAPLVLFTAGIMSLDSLQHVFPSLAALRAENHWLNAVVDGIFATAALSSLMAVLPALFLVIIRRFFRPISAARSRLFLEKLYFTFQLVFVLLVTALGQGFFTTLVFLAESPLGVLPLLARTLPSASHFYLAYMVMGWFACSSDIVRPGPLAKYVGLQAFMSPELAHQFVESQSDITGERYGKSALMFVVVLVFSSLSPPILIFGAIYFLACRVIYGYNLCFAEPARADLGGEFWVVALKQVHAGLIVYVLLMLGVLSAHGAGPVMLASPTLLIIVMASYNFDRRYVWQTLPIQAVAVADTLAASGELGEQGDPLAYMQPECRADAVNLDMQRLNEAAARLSLHHIAAGDGLAAVATSHNNTNSAAGSGGGGRSASGASGAESSAGSAATPYAGDEGRSRRSGSGSGSGNAHAGPSQSGNR